MYRLCRQFHRYAHAEISVVDQELYFEIFEKEFGRILRNNVSDCSSIEDKLSNALE